jgi:hypothetical protein
VSGFELHAMDPERGYEEWVAQACEAMDGFAPPFSENHHYFVAVTDHEQKDKVVAAAQLDVRSAWLGKMTFTVSPELNGHTSEVVEEMTAKIEKWARDEGKMSLDVAQRVKLRPGQKLERVNERDNPNYGRMPVKRIGL